MDFEERWFARKWTPEEEILTNFVCENEDLFDDMEFAEGSSSHKYVAIQISDDGGKTFYDESYPLPDQLAYFSYSFFDFAVRELPRGAAGLFNPETQTLTIAPEYLNDEAVILHEMIHLHEYVINDLPVFYHDVYLYSTYRYLKDKIDNLDNLIDSFGHIYVQQQLYTEGGSHDLLFLLKSYDLDLRKGYKLGTVLGYESPFA